MQPSPITNSRYDDSRQKRHSELKGCQTAIKMISGIPVFRTSWASRRPTHARLARVLGLSDETPLAIGAFKRLEGSAAWITWIPKGERNNSKPRQGMRLDPYATVLHPNSFCRRANQSEKTWAALRRLSKLLKGRNDSTAAAFLCRIVLVRTRQTTWIQVGFA